MRMTARDALTTHLPATATANHDDHTRQQDCHRHMYHHHNHNSRNNIQPKVFKMQRRWRVGGRARGGSRRPLPDLVSVVQHDDERCRCACSCDDVTNR